MTDFNAGRVVRRLVAEWELFYETPENRIMVVSYTAHGGSFFPGRPRRWSEKRILYAGSLNLDLAAYGKRFAVFPIPEALGSQKEPAHITFLLNFCRRAAPPRPATK